MAITDKEQGVWELDQVYNKINEGGIWSYTGEENHQLAVPMNKVYSHLSKAKYFPEYSYYMPDL